MIIIPELEKVIILVPRTGSTALKAAILKKYKNSFCLYRHMEADGVPHGYNYWEKIGVVRHPADRLWSLYKYLKDFSGDYHPPYIKKMRQSVTGVSFSHWIVNNEIVFTNPYDSSGGSEYFPYYTVLHSLPENKKSQFLYLRPDLGTKIYNYNNLISIEHCLGIKLKTLNDTPQETIPAFTENAWLHIERFLKWDLDLFNNIFHV